MSTNKIHYRTGFYVACGRRATNENSSYNYQRCDCQACVNAVVNAADGGQQWAIKVRGTR